jgi:IclR family acetate operon transcriptional repressor
MREQEQPMAVRDGSYEVRAVQRVLDILDSLHQSADGLSLAGVARATGLPRSSAFRYLATLEGRGYVEREPGRGRYRLGLSFLPLRVRRVEVLAARARPYLEELRARFKETINLGVLDGAVIAYVEMLESPQAVRFSARAGDGDPIHSTALGKAIAAQLTEDEVRRILAVAGMARRTSRTIIDPDEFLRELERVRARGYAVDDRENEDEGRCVAVALPAGRIPAAISLSAPAARFSFARAEDVAPALNRAATRLAAELEGRDA